MGHLDLVKTLLEAGAEVGVDDVREIVAVVYLLLTSEYTLAPKAELHVPLWYTCISGHLDVVKLLIEAGADINREYKVGKIADSVNQMKMICTVY